MTLENAPDDTGRRSRLPACGGVALCAMKRGDSRRRRGRWGHSSAGRALRWQRKGQEFESPCLHQRTPVIAGVFLCQGDDGCHRVVLTQAILASALSKKQDDRELGANWSSWLLYRGFCSLSFWSQQGCRAWLKLSKADRLARRRTQSRHRAPRVYGIRSRHTLHLFLATLLTGKRYFM